MPQGVAEEVTPGVPERVAQQSVERELGGPNERGVASERGPGHPDLPVRSGQAGRAQGVEDARPAGGVDLVEHPSQDDDGAGAGLSC